ncbi:MAG TPA: imidazole glycerol phosphate synthase subunit HisH [Blastocatellia bacterium]|jgi:glutamine amidotransferase|nr:imidazole glycerol phosphate synthase subunit HisH [Blastocatellia bacterium]
MLAIIDYGVGNLRSVQKALEAVGANAILTGDPGVIREADRLVLPGVGAFGECARRLRESRLDQHVLEAAERGKPVIGLCVGLQLMFDEGHEFGVHAGLGLMRGRVVRFPGTGPRVPQIGWNQVEPGKSHPLMEGIANGTYFYFVHSYYVDAGDPTDVLAYTEYGIRYPSICARGSVCGVQFHPEKSQDAGLKLLRNFASMRMDVFAVE